MKSRVTIVFLVVLALLLSTGIAAVFAAFGMECISVATDGTVGNDQAYNWARMSADGRYVAFPSRARNLVSDDSNWARDVFVRDRQAGTTTRVSVSSNGTQSNGDSFYTSISDDGRYVVFASSASNLVDGDSNGYDDVFLRDCRTGATTLVSVASDGTPANEDSNYAVISHDNRYVIFQSDASNLVAGDTNGGTDIFIRDLQNNTTTLISLTYNGLQIEGGSVYPSISYNNRYVAFQAAGSNSIVPGYTGPNIGLDINYQIFLRDLQANTTTMVSVSYDGTQPDAACRFATISSEGRYVSFASRASDIVHGDTNDASDIFIRDLQTGTTTRASLANDGTQANGSSELASMSMYGRYVCFYSFANNLVTGDTNGCKDIFVRDRQANTTTRVSVASDGTQVCNGVNDPSINALGTCITFSADGTGLIPGGSYYEINFFLASGFSEGEIAPDNISASVNTSLGTVGFNTSKGSISGLSNTAPADMRCSAPSGYIFPYGMFGFTITHFPAGQPVLVTISFPNPLPLGTKYIKCINGTIVDCSSLVTRIDEHTLQLNLTDGGQGDADGIANGTIVDPGGPAFPLNAPSSHQSSIPVTPQAPVQLANITVKSASLSSTKVTPGTPVTITADVANNGTGNGTSLIKIYVNGTEEIQQGVTVNSGSSAQVSFNISRSEPGTYTVYVGSTQAGSFTVDQFAPDTILFISGALVFFSLVGGMIWIVRKRV